MRLKIARSCASLAFGVWLVVFSGGWLKRAFFAVSAMGLGW